MRSSSLVLSSLVLVLFLSGFAGRGPVIGSEAGLTAGTPVLTAAELKALAPDPMPVVEDPQTQIKVTLKPVAAAEAATARAAAPKAKKPAVAERATKPRSKVPSNRAGEIVLSLKDDEGDEVEAAPKKAASKKTEVKKVTAKKADKKTAVARKADTKKKTDGAKKSDSAKKADGVRKPAAARKTEPAKKADAEKPAKRASLNGALNRGLVASSAGAAKIGKTRILPEDLPAEKADDEESDEEGDEGEEAPARPAARPAKSAMTGKAKPAVKPAKSARVAAKAPRAAKEGPEESQAADTEAAQAEAPAPVDPTVIAGADAAKYREQLVAFLAKAGAPEAGGSVSAKLASLKRGTLNYKTVVIVDGAMIHASACKFQTLLVKKAVMELRDLAFDEAQLKAGTCALVGKPTLVPDITLEHRQVQEKVAKNNVRNPRITYENNQMHFAGEVKVMFFKIGFKMAGKFERTGNNVTFRIAELFIRNSPASADRLASAQAKMQNMIKLEAALTPLGAPDAPVRGGKLSIEDGDALVYTTALDAAVLAE